MIVHARGHMADRRRTRRGKRAARRYFIAKCGAKVFTGWAWGYDSRRPITCKKCRAVIARHQRELRESEREREREERVEARAALKRVNVMRAQFGLPPVKKLEGTERWATNQW